MFKGGVLWAVVVSALCFAQAAAAAPAAFVEFAMGNVSAVDAAGAERHLVKGAEVKAGDTVDTGPPGACNCASATEPTCPCSPPPAFASMSTSTPAAEATASAAF